MRGDNLLGNLARHTRHAAQHLEYQTLEHYMVKLGVSLGYDHVGDISAHSVAVEIAVDRHPVRVGSNGLPIFPHLLAEVAAAAVGSDGVVALGSHANFHKMVARTDRAYCAVEIHLVHIHAFEHARNTVLREVESPHILGPVAPSLDVAALQVRQKLLGIELCSAVDCHSKLYAIADFSLNFGIVAGIDRYVGNRGRHRAANVATDVVGVDMVGKRGRETDHDILAGVYVGHDADFGVLKHRVVDKRVDHRQGLLLDIVGIYDAVFAVSSFEFHDDMVYACLLEALCC